jgi:mannitol-1-phosphate/altronate dehydrogenase
MLEGIRVHLERGSAWPLLAWALRAGSATSAVWMTAATRLMCAIRSAIRSARLSTPAAMRARQRLLTLNEIFGQDLPQSPLFVDAVNQAISVSHRVARARLLSKR